MNRSYLANLVLDRACMIQQNTDQNLTIFMRTSRSIIYLRLTYNYLSI